MPLMSMDIAVIGTMTPQDGALNAMNDDETIMMIEGDEVAR